jgi:hypothetical protein
MPKIPLYNEGAGPAIGVASGQLSPRASASAFTAPGRALTGYQKTFSDIGQVAQQFALAEKDAQTREALSDVEKETRLGWTDFNNSFLPGAENPRKAETREDYERQAKEYQSELEGRLLSQYEGYTKTQKARISDTFGKYSLGYFLDGSQKAFDVSQERRAKKADGWIESTIEALRGMNPTEPRAEFLRASLDDAFLEYETQGLRIKYDKTKVFNDIDAGQFDMTAMSSTDINQINDLRKQNNENTSITSSEKRRRNTFLNAEEKRIGDDLYLSDLETMTEMNASSSELEQIIKGFETGEDFSITREDGSQILFSPSNMPITSRIKMQSQAEKLQNEFTSEIRGGYVSDITNSFESQGTDGALLESLAVIEQAENKEDADAAILTSARSFDSKAKIAYAEGNFAEAELLAETAERLVSERFAGNPSLIENTVTGVSANTIMKSVANTRIDIQEKRLEVARINEGVNLAEAGVLDNFEGIYSNPEIKQILDTVLLGKSLPEQLDVLEQNNLTYAPIKGTIDGAATEGLGATPDFNAVAQGLELYRQVKVRGKGVLTNHTDEQSRAFFDSVLALEEIGVETEDAISRVSRAFNSGIDVNPRYATVKSEVDNILDNQVTTVFGFTIFGETVVNRVEIHQRLEDLSKIYIKMGTMSAEEAVEAAAKSITETHFNLRGQLIPRRNNYPQNIARMADLAAEDFMKKNPAYADDDIDLIPTLGRIDEWSIFINGQSAPYAKDPIYTLDDLKAFSEADSKTKIESLVQENIENRGLTEEDQLAQESQRLMREARELTGSNLARIRREQGEDAYQAAIAKRESLQTEAQEINNLLNQLKRSQSGS